jgi:hypothetical protein
MNSPVTTLDQRYSDPAASAVGWDGAWQYVVRDGRLCNEDADFPVELFAVTPTRAFSHSKGQPFGATTHRF